MEEQRKHLHLLLSLMHPENGLSGGGQLLPQPVHLQSDALHLLPLQETALALFAPCLLALPGPGLPALLLPLLQAAVGVTVWLAGGGVRGGRRGGGGGGGGSGGGYLGGGQGGKA